MHDKTKYYFSPKIDLDDYLLYFQHYLRVELLFVFFITIENMYAHTFFSF